MGFLYRSARKSDIQDILEIEKASHPHPWDEKAFNVEFSKAASGMNIFLVSEDEDSGEPAGYSVGNVIADYVHILNLAVADRHKKHGVATELLRRTEQEALKRKLGSITLEVRASNTQAINLYKKTGYAERGRRPGPVNAGEDDVLMWKNLL
ncbi:MAG: ribosomal protein S18-alanine N-acetyltransferase [Spirochaetia bacterium]|nr:ribosomal protein S18-alanine N-acetyltransferase [Spirochaetia bacterium]